MADLKENVKRMMAAGVPEQEIGAYIKQYGGQPQKAQPATPQTWGDVGTQAVQNITGSTLKMVQDLGNAALHPLDTIKGLYSLAKGASRALDPSFAADVDDKRAFAAVADFYKKRYGSMDGLKQAIAQDPAGVLGDVTTVIGGAGGVARGLGTAANASKLAKAGGMLTRAAEIADPVNLGLQALKAPARAIGATKLPERMYSSALKPSSRVSPEQMTQLFTTARENKIPVSPSGTRKIDNMLSANEAGVGRVLGDAAARGDRVSPRSAFEALDDTRAYYENTATPDAAVKAVDRAGEQFMDAHVDPDGMMPVDRAQAVKQNTQRELRKKYGERKTPMDEARKSLAYGLREELANKYPELRKLNENSAELLALDKELERAVGRIGNNELVSLRGTALGAGGIASGNPALLGGAVALNVLSMPSVKSRLGIALARARFNPKLGTRGPATRGLIAGQQRASEDYGR